MTYHDALQTRQQCNKTREKCDCEVMYSTGEDSIKQKNIFLSAYTCYYTNTDPSTNEIK